MVILIGSPFHVRGVVGNVYPAMYSMRGVVGNAQVSIIEIVECNLERSLEEFDEQLHAIVGSGIVSDLEGVI